MSTLSNGKGTAGISLPRPFSPYFNSMHRLRVVLLCLVFFSKCDIRERVSLRGSSVIKGCTLISFSKMKSIAIVGLLSLFQGCCDESDALRHIVITNDIDTELDIRIYYSAFKISSSDTVVAYSTESNSSVVIARFSWEKCHENLNDEFRQEIEFESDSIVFMTSEKRLVFTNPILDDSIDYFSKREAHFWNFENWYQENKEGDFLYDLSEDSFDKYGVGS